MKVERVLDRYRVSIFHQDRIPDEIGGYNAGAGSPLAKRSKALREVGMSHRFNIVGAVLLFVLVGAPVLADHEPEHTDDRRFEVTFMAAYDDLLGDAADIYDDGAFAGLAFEYAVSAPRTKGSVRSFNVRLVGGYAVNDHIVADSTLDGVIFALDGLLVFNATDVVKPYAFLGFGSANLSDDFEIVKGTDGIGFGFGAGSKFYFGESFTAMAELSHQDYPVDGRLAGEPSNFTVLQFRFGVGFRF